MSSHRQQLLVSGSHRINSARGAAIFAFVAALGVYRATLLPGVSHFDVAEMQTVPTVLGIAHPTGYPLFTMLGYLWTRLPFGSPAFDMNLLSAILFALSAAGLAVLATRLSVRPALAAIGGLIFAYAGETWARATEAEVHSLHTLLFVLLLISWVIAEQTNSRKAALLMFLAAGFGFAHHRTMVIEAPPILLWFLVRHLRWLKSIRFVGLAVAATLLPLLAYLYIPIRIAESPRVVNADTSKGWLPIARGTVFNGNESAFSSASPGRWLHHLPHYVNLAGGWLGWPVLALAIIGAAALARRSPAILVGLCLAIAVPTYGLANRLDLDYRWLIVPLLVLALLAAVGAETLTSAIASSLTDVSWVRAAQVAAVLAFAVLPSFAVVTHFHRYDRSSDTRDQVNAERILATVGPNAVIWAYWDIRTTLEYETAVAGLRPDVEVLDHRAYARYGCAGCEGSGDAIVAEGMAADPALAGRPRYFIPVYPDQLAAVEQRFTLTPVLQIDLPFGFEGRYSGWLYQIGAAKT